MLQVICGVAEFEVALIRSSVLEDIVVAKARGTYKSGRPVVMTDENKKNCREKYAAGVPMTRIAKDLGISRMTVYRELKKIDTFLNLEQSCARLKILFNAIKN